MVELTCQGCGVVFTCDAGSVPASLTCHCQYTISSVPSQQIKEN